jgi:hypothetical protein
MLKKHKFKAVELMALPISVGEARKLYGARTQSMSDDEVAREIVLLSELGRVLVKTLDLQK